MLRIFNSTSLESVLLSIYDIVGNKKQGGQVTMNREMCSNCGANDFIYEDGYSVCKYCNSKFAIESAENKHETSVISLQSDIDVLLQKCKSEPWNSRKFANLILDIDPTNHEAKKYL